MPITDPKEPLVPTFQILLNGALLPVKLETHIVTIIVDSDTELPDMFSIELTNSETNVGNFQCMDKWLELLAIGVDVEIRLGNGNQLESVISGEITALEPVFYSNRLPRLTVRGYDRSHRLQRGQHTRTFKHQKDSDIVEFIARDAGLNPFAVDSKVIHPYIMQANQSDWDFLRERAKCIDYELMVCDRNLFFHPVSLTKSLASHSLSLNDDVLEFSPRLSSMGQVSEVSVSSRNGAQQGNPKLQWTVQSVDEDNTSWNGISASQVCTDAFGRAVEVLCDQPVMSLAEAEQLARARFRQIGRLLITGEAVCLGRPELRPGMVITIEDINKQYSGPYYILATSQRFHASGTYTSVVTLQGNTL